MTEKIKDYFVEVIKNAPTESDCGDISDYCVDVCDIVREEQAREIKALEKAISRSKIFLGEQKDYQGLVRALEIIKTLRNIT